MKQLVPLIALTACGPVALKGNADLRLADLIVHQAKPAELVPLLDDEVVVHRRQTDVKGRKAAAEQLAGIVPGSASRVDRHHEVSLLIFDDHRAVLIQRSEADQVTRAVELEAPKPGRGGMNWGLLYYDKAWNTDEDRARLALLKAAYAETGRYVDATNDWYGPRDISEMISRFRRVALSPEVTIITQATDCGSGWVTFDWVIRSPQLGRVIFRGFDVAHLNAEGRLDFLAGFLGERKP